MSLLDKLKTIILGKSEEPAPTAAQALVAQPIEVNVADVVAVRQARYRIDAIQRHLAQHDEEGRPISDQRMHEFRTEIRERAAFLLSKKVITHQQADEIIASIEEVV